MILSNRDEALSRPTLRSHFWDPTSLPAALNSVEVSGLRDPSAEASLDQVAASAEATMSHILGGTEFAHFLQLLNS